MKQNRWNNKIFICFLTTLTVAAGILPMDIGCLITDPFAEKSIQTWKGQMKYIAFHWNSVEHDNNLNLRPYFNLNFGQFLKSKSQENQLRRKYGSWKLKKKDKICC